MYFINYNKKIWIYTQLMWISFCQQRQDQKRSDLDEQLKEYINEWRKQRAKEEEELKRLKEKQAKRKVSHRSFLHFATMILVPLVRLHIRLIFHGLKTLHGNQSGQYTICYK